MCRIQGALQGTVQSTEDSTVSTEYSTVSTEYGKTAAAEPGMLGQTSAGIQRA